MIVCMKFSEEILLQLKENAHYRKKNLKIKILVSNKQI